MSKTTDNKLTPVRTIRLPVDQIALILDEMDVEPAAWQTARRDSRYKYRLHEVVVLMQQPGVNAPMAYIVPTRNISARGLSFLHGGFVHPGTLCVVQLVTARGGQQNVVGVVRRCRYVQSNVHEVAVQFKSAIDPAAFCRDAVKRNALVAEDDPAVAKLCKHHLAKLHCEVEFAPDGPTVMEKVSNAQFDFILLDMELPPTNGYDVARDLRNQGFGGMIIAGTSSDGEGERARALESGCDMHMMKPFSYEQLAQATATFQCEPLFSSFHDDPAMNELVGEFVVGLPRKVRALEQALSAGDRDALRPRLAELKGESRGFGFHEIAEICQKAEAAIQAKSENEVITSLVRSIARMCAQARSVPNTSAMGTGSNAVVKKPTAQKPENSSNRIPSLAGEGSHEHVRPHSDSPPPSATSAPTGPHT